MTLVSNIPFPPFARDPSIGCKDESPETFYPVSLRNVAAVARAKRVCSVCPLQVQCGAWAVNVGEPAGIWGGMTPEERSTVRRMLGKVA